MWVKRATERSPEKRSGSCVSVEWNDIWYALVCPSSCGSAPSTSACDDPGLVDGAGSVAAAVIMSAWGGDQGRAGAGGGCALHAARQVVQEHLGSVMLSKEKQRGQDSCKHVWLLE